MMIRSTLYPCLLFGVLLLAGCGTDEPDAGTADTPPDAADLPGERGDTLSSTETAHRILVLGNSIAAGAGVDSEQAFPALLQERIDSLGWSFEVVNAGVSGATTADGLNRLDWLLRDPVSVLLIELGGNDGLRGIPTEVTKRNLRAIIQTTRERYPGARIVLAGMQLPPNLGKDYTERFRQIYPALADEEDVTLIPFLLEDVGGIPELNQSDGIHPTAAGHRIIAETVWETLEPVLASVRGEQITAIAP